jgi:ABC-type Fe3+-siderophore transport system permease subunit
MREKAVTKPYQDTPISPEEYRLFTNQGEPVLRLYRLARINMAATLPFFIFLSVFHAGIAMALALTGGITVLFLLRRKYGLKGAAAPLICALTGTAIGVFLFTPLIHATLIIQEAHHGF